MKYHRVKEAAPGTLGYYFQWIHFLWINFYELHQSCSARLSFLQHRISHTRKVPLAMSSWRGKLSVVFPQGANSWPPGLNLQLKWLNHQQKLPCGEGTPKTQTLLPIPLQLFPQKAPKNIGGNYISTVVSHQFYCNFPSSTKSS